MAGVDIWLWRGEKEEKKKTKKEVEREGKQRSLWWY
jgi:hypothetical protein